MWINHVLVLSSDCFFFHHHFSVLPPAHFGHQGSSVGGWPAGDPEHVSLMFTTQLYVALQILRVTIG